MTLLYKLQQIRTIRYLTRIYLRKMLLSFMLPLLSSLLLLGSRCVLSAPHYTPRLEHDPLNLHQEEYGTRDVDREMALTEGSDDENTDSESEPFYSNESDEAVHYRAYYPQRDLIRNLHFDEPDRNVIELPIHPWHDSRRSFMVRTNEREAQDNRDDIEGTTREVNTELAKQRAHRQLMTSIHHPDGGCFWSTAHNAAFFHHEKDSRQVRDALQSRRVPVLRKSQVDGSLRFLDVGESSSNPSRRERHDSRPDPDAYRGEVSDSDTEHLD